jgi:hypothetical protein
MSMRLAIFWFASSVIIIMFGLGDLGKTVRKIEFNYPGQPNLKG